MIARSDRVVPLTDEHLGDEVCAPAHSGSTAPTMLGSPKALGIVWGAKAEPPVFNMAGGFAVRCMRPAIYN
jgi:hypothetical protein